jgi:general secretion pathway protein E
VSHTPPAGQFELGEMLVRAQRVTSEQLEAARERQAESGRSLAELLIEDGLLTEAEMLETVGKQLDLPVRHRISADAVADEVVARVPIGFAKTHGLLPIQLEEGGPLLVVISDPFDTAPLDDLRLLFDGAEIETELSSRSEVMNAINAVYDRGAHHTSELAEDAATDLDDLASGISQEPEDLLDASDEAPIIRLVNSLLHNAVKQRASDIHLEPFENEIRVRFRIDDVLYEPVKALPRALHSSVVSRIKIMGQLNIAEKRLPQDGRIRLKIAGKDYDVRLSTVPIAHGERVVMRLLPRTHDMLNLERLGFNATQLQVWNKLISRPNGIVLVTGPTGSGKTTTLYGALARINTADKNIITIEDPVEIQLPGIGQIEVNPRIGLTFASGLRSVLRQDPNVILVGEIRDLETAEIAIQASLTGHLVFATLHTNDAASAITRLVDMGVEPFLVGSSLVAVLAQRLVRVLCTECKESYEPTPQQLAEIGITGNGKSQSVFRPVGCERCNQTGYRGRLGIFELMLVDDDIRAMVSQNVDSKAIKRAACQKGMHTLRSDGARRVLDGVTSIAEVLRATEDEGVVEQI